jgi:hypothetical protein
MNEQMNELIKEQINEWYLGLSPSGPNACRP